MSSDKMRVFILLALVGAALAGPRFNPLNNGNRIVGGSPTTVERWPFIASTQYGLDGYFTQWCGGTLLTRRSILSAAHCYYQYTPTSLRVRLGTSFASSGGEVFVVDRIHMHENYDDVDLTHDIAMLFLTTNAVLSDTIATAFIASSNFYIPDGTMVATIGWGALTQGGSYPEQLQEVDIYTINHDVCTERYAYLKSQPGLSFLPDVDDTMICLGILDEGGADACQGDSGGPALINDDVVIGVVSWGFGCGHPVYPGVYARVSYFTDWIVANGSA